MQGISNYTLPNAFHDFIDISFSYRTLSSFSVFFKKFSRCYLSLHNNFVFPSQSSYKGCGHSSFDFNLKLYGPLYALGRWAFQTAFPNMLHRGFSAWIVSEDEEMKEELTELNEETNTISCWIPGRPGKVRSTFQLCLDKTSDSPRLHRDSTFGGRTTTVVLTLVLSLPSMAFASQAGSSKAQASP